MAKLISFDIGSKYIKIAEGVSDKSNLNVKKMIQVVTPLNAIQEGYIKDMGSICNILRQTLTTNGFKTKSAIFNINTTSLITRTVELPILKRNDETIQMIRYELEQFLPVVLDEYKVVFRIIKQYQVEGIKKGSYLIYAVPTKLIDDYKALAENIGLNLYAIDLSFNSLEKVFTVGRSINGIKIEKDKAYYILEMGHKSLIFNVMCNNINLFTRLINLGGSDIDVSIENMFETDKDVAAEIKHKVSGYEPYQMATSEDSSVNNVIQTTIGEWISEVKRITQYFSSRNKDIEVEKLFLYGGSAKIINIEKYFESSLNIETSVIKDISGFSFDYKFLEKKDIDVTNYLDSIAGLLKSKSDMNLLSDMIKHRQQRLKKVFTGTLALGITALMILFYFLNYSLTMLSLNSEIDYFDSIINNSVYQEKYRSVQILKDKTNTLNSYKDLLTSLNANLSKTDIVKTELLNSLASSMPVDTSLASLSINGPNVAIQGKSVLRESVAQLVKNLSDLESIASVHAPTISRIESEDGSSYDFTINIVLKEVQ
ncbi:MAG TPA: hypothetical protein DCG34_02275 [Clostridiales bacterium]|nr:hypothetical protein [Clostridiales bacterium]